MRFVTAPDSVPPGICVLLTYRIGGWFEPACPDSSDLSESSERDRDPDKSGLETAPTGFRQFEITELINQSSCNRIGTVANSAYQTGER